MSLPDKPRFRRVSLGLMILGAVGFAASLAVDDFWEAYIEIPAMLIDLDVPEGEDAVAVAAILMLPVITIGPPALIVWLRRSRLLVWLLRACCFLTAGCLWYFNLTEPAGQPLLALLTTSTTLTFIGLCLVRRTPPPDPSAP